MNNEVQQFFNFVKSIYRELPRNMSTVFNYKSQIKLLDINEVNLDNVLSETYSSFQIITEKPNTKETQTVSDKQQIASGDFVIHVIANENLPY